MASKQMEVLWTKLYVRITVLIILFTLFIFVVPYSHKHVNIWICGPVDFLLFVTLCWTIAAIYEAARDIRRL